MLGSWGRTDDAPLLAPCRPPPGTGHRRHGDARSRKTHGLRGDRRPRAVHNVLREHTRAPSAGGRPVRLGLRLQWRPTSHPEGRKVQRPPFTVLGWQVPNIREAVVGLSKLGVLFERFPFLQQDDLGVWVAPGGTRVAWFKDPDGNVLSLGESGAA